MSQIEAKQTLFLISIMLIASMLISNSSHVPVDKAQIATPRISSLGYPSNETNVILLGWDGAQRNHLFDLLNRGLMPNLSSFIHSGTMVNITVSDHYTDTQAGWTQILTGYRWWKTGVFSNFIWFHSIPRGYTIPERLQTIFGKDQIATAFITGKFNHMETVDGTGSAAAGSVFATYSNEAIYSNLPSQLDVVSIGNLDHDRDASVVGPLTLQFLQNNAKNHFFAFFHFSDPDENGHAYGEDSLQYEQGIEACDYWLGQILTTLNALNITQKTLVYITADHGFDVGATVHHNAPYIFLASNDKNVSRNGDEVDVAPTVYYGLGLWNQTFTPPLDGYPLQLSLSAEESQHRQATLADTANLPSPTISIADNGTNQKIVSFTATDNNLAAAFLLVDNTLKTDGPWNWTTTNGVVTASGSYNINTSNLIDGAHNVKILAFDEHGANNGGPDNNPANGGGPSITSAEFYVGTPPLPSPTPSPPPTPTTLPTYSPPPLPPISSPSPSSSPTPSPPHSPSPASSSPNSPTPTPTLSSSPTQSPTPVPLHTPTPAQQPTKETPFTNQITYLTIGTVVAATLIIGAYIYKKRKPLPEKPTKLTSSHSINL